MRRLFPLLATLLMMAGSARATDITIGATTQPNFNPSNIGTAVTIPNVTIVSGTNAVLNCSACFRPQWVGMSGFYIGVGTGNYYVKSVVSTSQIILASDCPELTPATVTWHPYVEFRVYADRAFQPLGASYIVQPGTPGSGAWYKRYGASILTVNGVKTLYIPEIVIDATVDAIGPTNQARYTAGFYRPDNSLVQFYACAEQFRVPAVTPTSWTALCQYNSPPAIVPPANEAYTKAQIDARLITCSTGQMIYYAATGNQPSCLTVGTGLTITGSSILTTGGVQQSINIVTDYGCDPADNGGTADQTCFQNAINAAAATGGKTVYAPTGVYDVSGLTIPGGVTVEGDGRWRTIISSGSNAPILSLIEGSGSFAFFGPTIRNLGIRGVQTAGSSQDGIYATDNAYMFNVRVDSVDIRDTGGDGLYIGNVYSSWFSDIYIDLAKDFAVHYNAANMPHNEFTKIYVGNLTSNKAVAYRVRGGEFTCKGCNGVNNVIGGSKWAVVGRKNGVDGDTAGLSAKFTCIDCNLETWVANGVLSYYGSTVTLKGNTKIQMDNGGIGTGKPIEFDLSGNGVDYFAELIPRGYIEDTVGFTKALTSYASNQAIHANGYPPIQTLGTGPWIVTAGSPERVATFYNSVAAATRYLPRADGFGEVVTVTSSITLAEPFGVRYIEANCAAACTITIPWAGWYQVADALTIKDISGNAGLYNVTVNSGGGGTVNGASSYVLNRGRESVVLKPDGSSDWRVVEAYAPTDRGSRQVVNAADYGCTLTDDATNDTACLTAAIAAAQASGGKVLYLPTGTYNVDAITNNLNRIIIEGDGPSNSIIKARTSGYNVINVSGSGQGFKVTLRDLGVQGAGKAAGTVGHCIYINDSNSYLSEFELTNLEVSNCRQDGINIPYFFNGIIQRVVTDEIGQDHFDLGTASSGTPAGANTVTMIGNYVKTVGAYRVGYRIRTGGVTMIGNNGMDADTSANAFWGIFGQKYLTRTVNTTASSTTISSVSTAGAFQVGDEITLTGAGAGGTTLTTVVTAVNSGASTLTVLDAAAASVTGSTLTTTDLFDSYFRGAFTGNNVEDFGAYGIRLKEASKFGSISGNSFLGSSSGSHIALFYDFAGDGLSGSGTSPAGFFDQSNVLSYKGGSWTSSAAIHSQGVPFLVAGNVPAQYYETSSSALVDLPTFTANWDGTYGEMFVRNPNFQTDNLKIGVVTFSTLWNGSSWIRPPSNGVLLFCSDCKPHSSSNVCEGSGNGSLAVGNGANWICH